MKTLRHIAIASLVLAASVLASAETKTQSYSLAGFCPQGKPSDELIQQAAKAVEKRMAGMTLTGLPENADHHVEVLFRRDSFEIYVDALPLAGQRVGAAPDISQRTVSIDYMVERTHAAQTGNAYP